MGYRQVYSSSALNVRVDYVESKLDETIKDFKEANNSLKELIAQSEARIAADREAFMAIIKADREAAEARIANDRKEFASQKRWLIGIFVASVGIIGAVIYSLITITNAIMVSGINSI